MKNRTSKNLSALMAFFLTLSFLPVFTLTVQAVTTQVSTFEELKTAIYNFKWSSSEDMIIEITADITITEQITVETYHHDISLTIKSNGTTKTLSRGVTGDMIVIKAINDIGIRSSKLILEDIIIDGGRSGAYTPNSGGSLILIYANGVLTMKNGAKLQNNAITTDGGGAVYVNNGAFVMESGSTIDNCSVSGARSGGGVYVAASSGVFTMNGGTITGCTAGYYGGGVYVPGGTFTMNGGTISDCGGSGVDGGGVGIQRGTFNRRVHELINIQHIA